MPSINTTSTTLTACSLLKRSPRKTSKLEMPSRSVSAASLSRPTLPERIPAGSLSAANARWTPSVTWETTWGCKNRRIEVPVSPSSESLWFTSSRPSEVRA